MVYWEKRKKKHIVIMYKYISHMHGVSIVFKPGVGKLL